MEYFSKRIAEQFRFWFFCTSIACTISLSAFGQQHGGFSGGVTPSRFELNAQAGDISKRSISIYNLGDRPTQFNVRTTDWEYSAQGNISYSNASNPSSCRPWVRLERHKIKIIPSALRPRNFRFEVHVPVDAPPQECRFAIMIESLGDPFNAAINSGTINFPVTGRIAVIIYVAIGNVAPQIDIDGIQVEKINNLWLPVAKVINSGNAHGRLDSDLTGIDAKGNKFELSVATSPIMSGQTRLLPLMPDSQYRDQYKEVFYPLSISGKLYSDKDTFTIQTQVIR